MATMTANVARVILTDEEWSATLRGIHGALRPGGHLVFETRNPDQRPWLHWNREASRTAPALRRIIPGTGRGSCGPGQPGAAGRSAGSWRRRR
jgi:hypothetical protein